MSEATDAAGPAKLDAAFDLKPLMFEAFACTMALMAFVAVIGPIARILGLAPWQVGAAVTVAGLAWLIFARIWGAASDRRGRRALMLFGLSGFVLSYGALCLFLDAALRIGLPAMASFIGIVVLRTLAGVFYAAVPATSAALIADHTPPEERTKALAALGATNGVGMVVGPALAGLIAPYHLSWPLYGIAVLPLLALIVIWRTLPRTEHHAPPERQRLKLFDPRLRRAMAIAFLSMFAVAVAQIIVGFYALDRLGLEPGEAARAAGVALTAVGFALIGAQVLVRQINWPPARLIAIGGVVSALGFGAAFFAASPPVLWASYFVAAAGMGWVFPAFSTLAANAVEAHEQGATAGAVSSMQGLGVILGPLAGTLVYGIDEGAPYLMIAAAMLLAAALAPRTALRAKGAR